MGAFDNIKKNLTKAKDAVTPKFLKTKESTMTLQDLRLAKLSEYDKAMNNCPLFIDASAQVANQLLTIGVHAKLNRPVLVIRGIKPDHSDTKAGTTLLAYNFRKLITKYEPNFIIRIDLSGFRNLSIATLNKSKVVIAKIAAADNEGIVTFADDAQFITINQGEK